MEIQSVFFNDDPTCVATVLICDDDPLAVQVGQILQEKGCNVRFLSPEEILQPLNVDFPSFLLIDPDSCDPLVVCSLPDSTIAPIVWSRNDDPFLRNRLFKCGLLDFLSKNDDIDETIRELVLLFKTVRNNITFHVTFISPSQTEHIAFRNLSRHRNYRQCYLYRSKEAQHKWMHDNHELPDLIVLDISDHDHKETVFELVRYVRMIRLSELVIIVLIHEHDPHLISKLYRAGVDDVLLAPYSAEELLNSMTRYLDYRIGKRRLKYEQSLSNQLKNMINSSSIVSKTDPEGNITYVNQQFCQISGFTQDELIGQPHSIVRHPDNSPLIFERMWNILQQKKIFQGMMMNRRKDGGAYYVDTTIAPILDDGDDIIEYISIRHDITPLIEKQHQIESKRQKIQDVLDAQHSLICMVDKIDGIRQANRGFYDFLGISQHEREHWGFHNLHELFMDIDNALQIRHGERYVWLERLYELRGKFVKVAMRGGDANHRIFSIHVEKIYDDTFSDGVCYLVSFDDVTELNRALKEAKEASETESRFLATMSHEIRTPLNGILGFTELLRETPLDTQQRQYLQAVESSGETLRQIINDILEVMKLEREEIELHNAPITLIPELETLLYPFYAQAAKKGVLLLVFIDPALPITVNADLLRLKQILINLIGNAIKFTSSGKRVYVRIKNLSETGSSLRIGITVADEGIGIHPDHKEKIFKAFVQANNSIAREFGGTGLGLNIVLRVTKAMGGNLSFRSIYGKGSVFSTRFTFDSECRHYAYSLPKENIYFYIPWGKPIPKSRLIERYIKRFNQNGTITIDTLHQLSEKENNASNLLFVFPETLGRTELSSLIKRFERIRFYLVPSTSANSIDSFKSSSNVRSLPAEPTWSVLCTELDLCDTQILTQLPSVKQTRFKGLKILIAEDNEVNRFYIQEVLGKLGIDFEMAHDGYEAVKKFITSSFNLVLMDINMPNLDGVSATQQIRRLEQEMGTPHTPIIGLSADAVDKNIAIYLSHGLDGYLIKPLRKSELIRVLEELFFTHIVETDDLLEENIEHEMHPKNHATGSLANSVSERLELPLEIIFELFRKYIANAQALLAQLFSEVEVKNALHSLKGISQNLYLEPISSMCTALENDLKTLEADEITIRIDAIHQETDQIITRMQQELNA